MSNKGFFMAPELDLLPEEANTVPFLKALGYKHIVVGLYDDLQEAGVLDEYSELPFDAIKKIDIPPNLADGMDVGYQLKGVYDSEDGPVALYLKPVAGLALQVLKIAHVIEELATRLEIAKESEEKPSIRQEAYDEGWYRGLMAGYMKGIDLLKEVIQP